MSKQSTVVIKVPLEEDKQDWITIKDSKDSLTILKSYVDVQSKSIIDAITNRSMSFSEIVSLCNIPQTSCYRKVLSMVKDGLIAESNPASRSEIKKYMNTLKSLKVNIVKDGIILQVKPALRNFRLSNQT